MSTKIVKLLQPCYVETWHHQQKLDYGTAEAGEEVTLFGSNGYRTVLKSMKEFEDKITADNDFGEYSDEERDAARDRLNRTLGPEGEAARLEVYGKLYEESP